MALKAISYRILVKPTEIETKTASGLVLAIDMKLEKGAIQRGTVVDIGEDAFKAFNPTTKHAGLKIGDVVHFARYAGKFELDPATGDEYMVLNDQDITVIEC